jgi:hypothetical protein
VKDCRTTLNSERVSRPRGPRSIAAAALLLASLAAFPVHAELSRENILELYTQGKTYFRQATESVDTQPDKARDLFKRAAMAFETIVREGGIHNGRLYYNIGNAYFRSEDLGRAILNYKRALQYAPNDPNLQQNLAYARARRQDRIPEPENRQVLRTLFFWHYDFSLRVRATVFMCAFGLLWVALSIRLFRRSAWLHWAAGLSAVVCVMMFGSLAVEYRRQHDERPGVIVASRVVARKGDSETYEKAFTEPLHAGTEFTVLEDRGKWLEVALADGRTCWLPNEDVALVR